MVDEGSIRGIPGFADGKRFDFSIHTRDLLKTPEWKQDQEHPPLSPKKAENLAKSKLRTLVNHPNEWSIDEIALHDVKYSNRWFYVVKFSGRTQPHNSIPLMVIVVLMDGTTPEPKVVHLTQSK